MRSLLYLIAFAILAGYHLLAISYPEGAWSDDWLGYYASSARWFSATGPMEVGRRIMVDAFDPTAATARDREVARAVFHTTDPYMGWAAVHAFLLRLFSISPDTGFLVLHLFGVVFYLFSLKIFVQSGLSELISLDGRAADTKRLAPITVLLQVSYLGNPLFIGPAIFSPAMFVLPFALLFIGLLPKPSTLWLRIVLLCAMIVAHSSGIIFTIVCLGASFLYGAIGVGPGIARREGFLGFLQEVLAAGIFFAIVVGAGRLQWIPLPYPLSVGDFGFGFDLLGARRSWRFVRTGLLVTVLWVVPLTLFAWYRSRRAIFPLPIAWIVWITLVVCSGAMLTIVQTWTHWQPALVRFLYVGWPLFLVCVFLTLVWLATRRTHTWLIRVAVTLAILLLVASNVKEGVRFFRPLSAWRSLNNCRFLVEPTRAEIRRLSGLPGGFLIVFSARAGGSVSFMAGAGDHPVFYTRLTPDWKQRVEAQQSRFVLVVTPASAYLNRTITDPTEAPRLEGGKWKIAQDQVVSRKGSRLIGSGDGLASLGRAAEELHHPGWGCDGDSSPYRLLVYERVQSVS